MKRKEYIGAGITVLMIIVFIVSLGFLVTYRNKYNDLQDQIKSSIKSDLGNLELSINYASLTSSEKQQQLQKTICRCEDIKKETTLVLDDEECKIIHQLIDDLWVRLLELNSNPQLLAEESTIITMKEIDRVLIEYSSRVNVSFDSYESAIRALMEALPS